MKIVIKNREQAGFTLLEVMVSLSVIAVIFVSVFRMQSESIRLAALGKFNTLAPVLAGQLLAEIETDIEAWSETEGEFGSPYEYMTWTCAISEDELGTSEIIEDKYSRAMKKIDIEVRDPEQAFSYTVTSWRFSHDALE